MSARQAVLLDRDGVINADSGEFVKSVEELRLLPGAAAAIARLARAGLAIVIVTNQSGIPRGLLTEETLAAMHSRLQAEIVSAGGRIAGIYHCPHLPEDRCECRKPAIGLALRAAAELGLNLSRSYMVGDRPADIEFGAAAGCRTILVLTGKTARYDSAQFTPAPDAVCDDLEAAAAWILNDLHEG